MDLNLQELINNGIAWKLEGAIGRAADTALEAGQCMLPEKPFFDYYGNQIPARYMLKPGTKGTRELVVKNYGKEYAKELETQ